MTTKKETAEPTPVLVTTKPTNCIIPAPEVRDYVVAMIARHGLLGTARELGISKQTVRTISLGGPCFRGSIAIVREAMRARPAP